MIERRQSLAAMRAALKRSPVTLLVGPRQSGKTTLARLIVPPSSIGYFDLVPPEGDRGHRRVPAAARPVSHYPRAGRQETLARAVSYPWKRIADLGAGALARHWRRGGFPRSYLARTESDSLIWRQQFIQTYLERDLPELGVSMPAPTMLRLWTMLAHSHAQVWNAAEPARSLGISMPTVRRYLGFLTGLYLVRQLQPWHENLGKRQVKAPKLYIRDSGIFHALHGLASEKDILSHPKAGASWEGYVLEEILQAVPNEGAFFWATHTGAELDLLLLRKGGRYGVEIKHQDAPRLTASMRITLQDLKLDHLTVIYPGDRAYPLADRVDVIPFVQAIQSSDLIAPPARLHLTAIIERDGTWYIGYCPEIPGANGQGETVDECKRNLAEAIALILEDGRGDAQRGLPADAVQDIVG